MKKGNKKNTKTTLKQNLLTSSQGKLSNGVKNWHDLTLPNFAHLRGKITFRNLYPFFRYTNFFVLNSKLFKKQVNCSKNNQEVFQKFLELF